MLGTSIDTDASFRLRQKPRFSKIHPFHLSHSELNSCPFDPVDRPFQRGLFNRLKKIAILHLLTAILIHDQVKCHVIMNNNTAYSRRFVTIYCLRQFGARYYTKNRVNQ